MVRNGDNSFYVVNTVFPHIIAAATILFWIHLERKLFKERKLIKGGNYMRKYGNWIIIIGIQTAVLSKIQNPISEYTGKKILLLYGKNCKNWKKKTKKKKNLQNWKKNARVGPFFNLGSGCLKHTFFFFWP